MYYGIENATGCLFDANNNLLINYMMITKKCFGFYAKKKYVQCTFVRGRNM